MGVAFFLSKSFPVKEIVQRAESLGLKVSRNKKGAWIKVKKDQILIEGKEHASSFGVWGLDNYDRVYQKLDDLANALGDYLRTEEEYLEDEEDLEGEEDLED